MTREEIYLNLCAYDERNPYNVLDEDITEKERLIKKDKCSCDNCFYGRSVLAIELLKYVNLFGC